MARRPAVAANAAADAAVSLLEGGALRLLTSDKRVLVELPLSFRRAIGGEAKANPSAAVAIQTGLVTAYEAVSPSGKRGLWGDADELRLDRAWIEAGAVVAIESLVYAESL